MHRIFQSFVDKLSDGADAAALEAALAEAAAAFGFPLFAYFSIPRKAMSTTWLVSNYSTQWTELYLRDRFDQLDPVIHRARAGDEPFVWGEGAPPTSLSEQERRFFDAASQFSIRRGLTLPIHERRVEVAAVTFAADDESALVLRTIERHAQVLQLMAIYFHRRARQVLSNDCMIDGVILTRRERQCLEWAAEGKSARDIGQIIGVSKRTVAFHLDNARAKLDVRSVTQAVARLAACKGRG